MRTWVVLSLSLVSGAALADPVGDLVGGVTGLLGGTVSGTTGTVSGATGAAAGTGSLVGLPPLATSGSTSDMSLSSLTNLSSDQALPGLGAEESPSLLGDEESPSGDLIGLSVLQPGNDGSDGYSNLSVLTVDGETVIGEQADGRFSEPVAGSSDNGETVDIAILDGNSTSQPADDGVGVALISGDDTATGGAVGVAVLSGTGSGYGDNASVGVLNQSDAAHVCLGDSCVTNDPVIGSSDSAIPYTEVAPGIVLGGGEDATVDSSNPLVNVGVLTGDNAGTGGMVGVGVIAGDNSGQGDLIGACVLCGDNSGLGGLVGVAAGSGDNSGNGGVIGVATLSGPGSGSGGLLGVGVLNRLPPNGGGNSGNLPYLNVPVGSAGSGAVKAESSEVAAADNLIADDDSQTDEDAMDWRIACLIVVKDVKDTTTQSMKRSCRGRAG